MRNTFHLYVSFFYLFLYRYRHRSIPAVITPRIDRYLIVTQYFHIMGPAMEVNPVITSYNKNEGVLRIIHPQMSQRIPCI